MSEINDIEEGEYVAQDTGIIFDLEVVGETVDMILKSSRRRVETSLDMVWSQIETGTYQRVGDKNET